MHSLCTRCAPQASQSEGELERQRAAAATLAAEVSAAQARNAALQGQLGAEHSAREAAACDLASAAAQVAQEVARSLALQSAVAEAEAARVELGRRMQVGHAALPYPTLPYVHQRRLQPCTDGVGVQLSRRRMSPALGWP